MGCKQSTLRTDISPAVPQQTVAVTEVRVASPIRSEPTHAASPMAENLVEPMAPSADDLLAEIFRAPSMSQTTAASPVSQKAASPVRLGERAPSVLNTAAASPMKPAAVETEPVISFSEFLAQQENVSAPENPKKGSQRKVVFDSETMRKSAPKTQQTPSTKLTKKQREMVKNKHVSVGRRGPVASRFEKGSKAQMQNDMYLQMANAFERLLTNAETINAHLDSR